MDGKTDEWERRETHTKILEAKAKEKRVPERPSGKWEDNI
jgi:hypothetical protein